MYILSFGSKNFKTYCIYTENVDVKNGIEVNQTNILSAEFVVIYFFLYTNEYYIFHICILFGFILYIIFLIIIII